ncbi:hypothetical protein [Streptomyces sp. Ru87]|uniref:hypothetical protein n=1 Tax=Streptomyces sp. Ru87 TaxID=2044307 RepID=UPI00117F2318|nr:hypothetical protein [Streptomyces sp. Ru87]
MTKEHILPKWMREEFPELAREPVFQGSQNEHDGPTPDGPRTVYRGGKEESGPFNRQAPVVCGPCNNGWMSQLETNVHEPLSRMIRGLPTVLTSERQAVVALWSAKTLMVAYRAPHFGPRPRPEVILPVDAERLYQDRALGPMMVMGLANYQPTPYAREPLYVQSFTRMEHEGGAYSYCATLRIGHFAAQLVRCPDGMYPPLGQIPPHLVLLRPGASAVHWPPSRPIRAGAEWDSFVNLPEETGT